MVGERLYVTPHLILHTSHSILHTPHSTLSTPHSTLYTLHLTLQALHSMLCTLHFTLCPFHSTLDAPHFTLYTVHSPHNSHSPPPTVIILSPLVHRSPNHLQHLWNCYPCFATLRHPFLSITSHPLANSLVPNPNERCSPLSFGVPPFSSIFPLLLKIFLSFFSYLFPVSPPFSSISPLFSTIFLHFPWFFLQLDDGWPESEKDVFQAGLRMVVVKDSR